MAYFAGLRKPPKHQNSPRNHLSNKERGKIVKTLLKVCDVAESLFREEHRVLRVAQPCVVFGDTHGNLADVLTMEDMFWKADPSLSPQNFLFLGDYVDRGAFSFEVVAYLFCQKILAPGKFLLLRGNHEFRMVNETFNFFEELRKKFGEADGQTLYERFNKVFEWMPLAAVIDGKISCAHGGVPSYFGAVCRLSTLDRIPAPLKADKKTTSDSPPYWDLVWSDPVDKQAFDDQIAGLTGAQMDSQQYKTGFLPNTKRGAGKFWSETATKNFLSVNKLDFVIRAHEVAVNGFLHHHGGLVTTVFSSSNYQNSNDAGAILVQDFKLRPVKLIPGGSQQKKRSWPGRVLHRVAVVTRIRNPSPAERHSWTPGLRGKAGRRSNAKLDRSSMSGGVAHMVERPLCMRKARGSIPRTSTSCYVESGPVDFSTGRQIPGVTRTVFEDTKRMNRRCFTFEPDRLSRWRG